MTKIRIQWLKKQNSSVLILVQTTVYNTPNCDTDIDCPADLSVGLYFVSVKLSTHVRGKYEIYQEILRAKCCEQKKETTVY